MRQTIRMSVGERLRIALATKGISKSELARRVGVSAASVTYWTKGETDSIRGNHLIAAAQALGINPSWLETGKGQIAPADHLAIDEGELVALFRELEEAHRAALLSLARALHSAQTRQAGTTLNPYSTQAAK